MGRGKIEMKKIENRINRQVTFSKRRMGLFKKAHELSVLCDSQIAIIIFAGDRDKIYEFVSKGHSLPQLIERYQSIHAPLETGMHLEAQSKYQEIERLKAKFEALQRRQRNLLGEDLGPLNIKELQQLEKQIEASLAQTRLRKTKRVTDHMEVLRKQERHLGEINKKLRVKKMEIEAEGHAYHALCSLNSSAANSFSFQPTHPNLDMTDNQPVLQMGYPQSQYASEEAGTSRSNMADELNFFQGWHC